MTWVKDFIQPDKSLKSFGNICWYSNIENDKRRTPLYLCKKYSSESYPKYDNYLAFNVDKVADIPMDDYIEIEIDEKDYPKWKESYGDDVEMIEDVIIRIHNPIYGVHITFLDKYCPEQFEIIWQASGNTRVCCPSDILSTLNYTPIKEDRGGCGVVDGKRVYSRIFIKRK